MSQDIRMCVALLFYTSCYRQECLKLEEEDAPLKLCSGKFEAGMRKQLHAMHDLIVRVHRGFDCKIPLSLSVLETHKEN